MATIVLIAGSSLVYFAVIQTQTPQGSCPSFPGGSHTLKSQLQSVAFDAVTKFKLPSPGRAPNAITVSPDGSVWFGEQALPGVGHLFPNGTLIEYAWPFSYQSPSFGSSSCYKTDIWGVALWNGRVWASDVVGNQLVGVDSVSGSVTTIRLPINNSFPNTVTVGPDNSLWITELDSSKIGKVLPNGTLVEYALRDNTGKKEVPTEITFVNSTLGYYESVGGVLGSGGPAIFAFDPQHFSPYVVASNANISYPDSLAFAAGGLWIDQHGPSIIAFYNLTTGKLTPYPTSTISYTNTVLPYFIKSNGSSVWFNEHYGNRIARIEVRDSTLTEYNEADPPPQNGTQIDNTLTFALGAERAWFTEWTANYIGYVDASYRPNFSLRVQGNSTLRLPLGGDVSLTSSVSGLSSKPLSVQFSDSETFGAKPENIAFSANVTTIPSLNGRVVLAVTIKALPKLQAGEYTALITVSDGLLSQSAFVFIDAG